MKKYKCQSCGMPLNKDPENGGTNSDGSKNMTYCSHCFVDGKFTRPDIKLDDMKALVKGKLQEMGFPGILAGFFTKGISKLDRWNKV